MCNFHFFVLYNITFIVLFFLRMNIKSNITYCLVIRVNYPTTKQVLRYLKWRKYFPSNFNFYLLLMKNINYSLLTTIKTIHIVSITFNKIKSNYPNILNLKGNCSSFKSSKLLSWISHSESLILFYKSLKVCYQYIWIIEQDVGFVGNLYNFIKQYDKQKSDLITIGVGKITNKWVWFNCATEKYIIRRSNLYRNNCGYSNREYVQRWSKLYIANMMIDLENGYHSQTETSSIELVFYHNLTYEVIPNRFIGSPLCAGRSISEDKWINISFNNQNSNKFFHPLKF